MTTPQLPQNQGQEQKGLEVQTLDHQVWKLILNCLNVKDMDHKSENKKVVYLDQMFSLEDVTRFCLRPSIRVWLRGETTMEF